MSRYGHPARTISAETSLVTEATCSRPRLGQPGHTLRLLASLRSPGLCPRSFPNWGGPPPGTLGDVWGRLWLSHGGCSWHRVGGGHERCSAPHGAHDGPTERPAQCPQCEGSWSVPTHPGPQACELSRVLDGSAHVAQSPGEPWGRLCSPREAAAAATPRGAAHAAERPCAEPRPRTEPRPRPTAGAATHLRRHRVARGPRGHSAAGSTSGSRLGWRERGGAGSLRPLTPTC